jgi:hypothetical protein
MNIQVNKSKYANKQKNSTNFKFYFGLTKPVSKIIDSLIYHQRTSIICQHSPLPVRRISPSLANRIKKHDGFIIRTQVLIYSLPPWLFN